MAANRTARSRKGAGEVEAPAKTVAKANAQERTKERRSRKATAA